MRIFSWNVNGYRAVLKNGFLDWLNAEKPDVVCLQETKVNRSQLTEEQANPLGYHSYWVSADKAGYSGVSILSRSPIKYLNYKIGEPEIDSEGRFLEASFEDFDLISSYFPNSQRDHARLDYKLAFCNYMQGYMQSKVKSGRDVIVCGDVNVAHKEIDLKNPKTNMNNAGFLPAERNWMTEFLDSGFVDGFRQFNPEPDNYTWWSYRPGVREKNIGWRLDYFLYNEGFKAKVQSSKIHPSVKGSDHCPIELMLDQ
jgi:exodeoxyribonuclease-3